MTTLTAELRAKKLTMLEPLALACTNCTMCELGARPAERNGQIYNQHVFSTMTPSRFIVVGQNPGWNEVVKGQPFVGAAGGNFEEEIKKHGLTRTDFYICNAVRCYTAGNTRPTGENLQRCEPFLRMEINLLKPRLVIALGAVAFEQLCPGTQFTAALGRITRSDKFRVPVFPIYHPSPLNLEDGGRRAAFTKQINLMCGLVRALQRREREADH